MGSADQGKAAVTPRIGSSLEQRVTADNEVMYNTLPANTMLLPHRQAGLVADLWLHRARSFTIHR